MQLAIQAACDFANIQHTVWFFVGRTEHMERVTSLLKALGVQTLSECVDETPTTEMYEPCPALQLYTHRVVPCIQRLLATEHEDVYAELKDKHINSKLGVLGFAQVSADCCCVVVNLLDNVLLS